MTSSRSGLHSHPVEDEAPSFPWSSVPCYLLSAFLLLNFSFFLVIGRSPLSLMLGSNRPSMLLRHALLKEGGGGKSPLALPSLKSLLGTFTFTDPEFKEVVMSIAGPERTLIVTQVTFSYLDFLENWYTSVARLGYAKKVLFIADDELAFKHLKEKWPWQTVSLPSVYRDWLEEPSGGGPLSFNAIVSRRPFYLQMLLDLNLTVLYNDVDMVWVEDPFPFFRGDYDMLLQEDGRLFDNAIERFADAMPAPPLRVEGSAHQMCTCFMFIRPTQGSKDMVRRWGQGVKQEVARLGRPVPNQVLWNKVVLEVPEEERRVGVLPVVQFPSGCIYFGGLYEWCKQQQKIYREAVKHGAGSPVVIHNNWFPGHEQKLHRFKEHNLWLLDSPTALDTLNPAPIPIPTPSLHPSTVTA